MDIRKYFPSVDHAILKEGFRRFFKEPRLLAMMDRIVDSGTVPEPFIAYFAGDSLFTPYLRSKGLPIGNLMSQLWANLYLSSFDHWVKGDLKAPAYLRFVDDFVLLHDSKEILTEWLAILKERLAGLRLLVHPLKCVIRRTDEGLPFLGYVVWPDRIRVRGETVRRFRRAFRRRARGSESAVPEIERSLAAWKGHVQLAGSWRRLGGLR